MKMQDMIVVDEFTIPQVALERKGQWIIFANYTEMVFEYTNDPEFTTLAKQIYSEIIDETPIHSKLPYHQWAVNNFYTITSELGYQVIRAQAYPK